MKRTKTRVRKTAEGEQSMFSGLLVCSECGRNLHHHVNTKNRDIKFFSCPNYKGNRGTCETTHYVRVDFLEAVVLQEIHRLTHFARQQEDAFAKLVMGHSLAASEAERGRKQKELYAKNARIREINKLIERLYEDNVSGKIADERFARMTANYEAEQGTLMEEVKALTADLYKEETKAVSTEDFMQTVRKCTRAKKLTYAMLHARIEVYHPEQVEDKKIQRLVIHYHCVGDIQIPEHKNLATPAVELQTRKGVALSYSP